MSHPSPVRPVAGLARVAIAGLVLDSVVAVARAGVDLSYAALADRLVTDPGLVAPAELRAGDLLVSASQAARVLVFLAAAAAFLAWLARVRANAVRLSPDGHRYGRFWVVAGWVMPIGWFWIPRHVVHDVWRASAPPAARGLALINLWWAAWLVAHMVSRTSWVLTGLTEDPAGTALLLRLDVAGIGLMLVAAVLAVAVVRRVTGVQEALRRPGPAGPAPLGDAPLSPAPLGGAPLSPAPLSPAPLDPAPLGDAPAGPAPAGPAPAAAGPAPAAAS
ncbi:DUF4328 domain-containing protein [Actinomadura sp. ATCC 31491]|uniref:DUF4328 domain-containing protein n=1 Tax=Actinomadura luzonensis TaxID=2805427 RepID=A0ABT0G5M8_9ACTN|nr:DUF4328 domain-containing protein [Actinomadura luzonensis]MCK2219480.1 DUF4328 domain-containing protein [Actinomadura luzonensis]